MRRCQRDGKRLQCEGVVREGVIEGMGVMIEKVSVGWVSVMWLQCRCDVREGVRGMGVLSEMVSVGWVSVMWLQCAWV
ncbi:hypothetical protein Pcinc_043602 [Petrolisthes cinctipes]|uniref:Uncharacterized protein n=1 Tax=Petrolisthes cinctipes TaxID=88211 RepID=A0AAE1BFC6_PETCI|nr:hypothetical protein Pcinc_043602 [Petrolisthes cinctipes]